MLPLRARRALDTICDVAAPTDPGSPTARYRGVNPHACDDEAAERLWGISEQLLAAA